MPNKPTSNLAMLIQITDTKWFGTCRTCHVLVDRDAEQAHEWWHNQANKNEVVQVPTRAIKTGRHMA